MLAIVCSVDCWCLLYVACCLLLMLLLLLLECFGVDKSLGAINRISRGSSPSTDSAISESPLGKNKMTRSGDIDTQKRWCELAGRTAKNINSNWLLANMSPLTSV